MQDLNHQDRYHLAMWLTTLFDTPTIIHPQQQYFQPISMIHAFQKLNSKKRIISHQIKMYVVSTLMDCKIVSIQSAKIEHPIMNRLKKIRKQLQIQYHREKLLYCKKLIEIPIYRLFLQLDSQKLGYLTINNLQKYILKYLPNHNQIIKKQTIYKLTNNIHPGDIINTKIYLENFGQLVSRINCHPINGTIKYINQYIDNYMDQQRLLLIKYQYLQLKRQQEKNRQIQYQKQLESINLLANYIAEDKISYPMIQQINRIEQQQKVGINKLNMQEQLQVDINRQKLFIGCGQQEIAYQNDIIEQLADISQKQTEVNYYLKERVKNNNQILEFENLKTPELYTHHQNFYLEDREPQTVKKDRQGQQEFQNNQKPTYRGEIIKTPKQKKNRIKQQLDRIKLQRVKNRINMYLYS